MPTTRRSSRRLSSAPLKEAASTRRVTRSTPAKRAAPALSRTSRSKRRLTLEKPKPSPRKSTRGRKKAVVESSSEEEAESSDDGESETKTVRRGSRKRKISKAMQEALKQNGKRAVKKKAAKAEPEPKKRRTRSTPRKKVQQEPASASEEEEETVMEEVEQGQDQEQEQEQEQDQEQDQDQDQEPEPEQKSVPEAEEEEEHETEQETPAPVAADDEPASAPTGMMDIVEEEEEEEEEGNEAVEEILESEQEIASLAERYSKMKNSAPGIVFPLYDGLVQELLCTTNNDASFDADSQNAKIESLRIELKNRQDHNSGRLDQLKEQSLTFLNDAEAAAIDEYEIAKANAGLRFSRRKTRSIHKVTKTTEVVPTAAELAENVSQLAALSQFEKAKKIVNHDASRVDEVGDDGNTALFHACGQKNLSMAKILLRKGASPSFQNTNGDTALHISFRNSFIDVIPFLLQCGGLSVVDCTNNANVTPLDEAYMNQINLRPLGLSKYAICTYTKTGPTHTEQVMYECLTCNLHGNEGVCVACVDRCHSGHITRVTNAGIPIGAYCDCGAASCDALTSVDKDELLYSTVEKEMGEDDEFENDNDDDEDFEDQDDANTEEYLSMQATMLDVMSQIVGRRSEKQRAIGELEGGDLEAWNAVQKKRIDEAAQSASASSASAASAASAASSDGDCGCCCTWSTALEFLSLALLVVMGLAAAGFFAVVCHETTAVIQQEHASGVAAIDIADANYLSFCSEAHMSRFRYFSTAWQLSSDGHLSDDLNCNRFHALSQANRTEAAAAATAAAADTAAQDCCCELVDCLKGTAKIIADTTAAKAAMAVPIAQRFIHGSISSTQARVCAAVSSVQSHACAATAFVQVNMQKAMQLARDQVHALTQCCDQE